MTLRRLFPVLLVLGLWLSYAGEASAVADCSICGPNKACSLRCSLNCPGPGCFVTTCGEVGPCRPFLLGADLPESTGDAPAVCGADPVQSPLFAPMFATWMQEVASWMKRAVDHLAVLVEPGRVAPAPTWVAIGGSGARAG